MSDCDHSIVMRLIRQIIIAPACPTDDLKNCHYVVHEDGAVAKQATFSRVPNIARGYNAHTLLIRYDVAEIKAAYPTAAQLTSLRTLGTKLMKIYRCRIRNAGRYNTAYANVEWNPETLFDKIFAQVVQSDVL